MSAQSEAIDPCQIDTAHCEDCGTDEWITGPRGLECEECGGDIVNRDQCDGGH